MYTCHEDWMRTVQFVQREMEPPYSIAVSPPLVFRTTTLTIRQVRQRALHATVVIVVLVAQLLPTLVT